MPRSAVKTADPSTDPTPPPLPQRPPASPLFVPPSTTPEPSLPSQTQESDPYGTPAPDPADLHSSSDTSASPSDDPGGFSTTPSSGSGVKLSKAGLRAGLGVGFRQVCKVVAAFIADEDQREAGLWEPDADDVQDVAAPAANIVYRRLPDEAKGGDVIDLFALGLALVGYVGKNLAHRSQLRARAQLLAAQGIEVNADGVNGPVGG